MDNLSVVILAIMGANVLFSYKGFTNRALFDKYKFNIGAIHAGEKVRMFSSGFLHGDWMHLIFNMYSFYMFAPIVVSYLGSVNFLIIYLGALLLGNLLSFYFHKSEYNYSAIGASGAVSGIIYSSILLYPEMSLYFFIIPIPIPGYVFGIGYLLYSIYGMRSNSDNIGHDAHFGGAIGGYLLTLLIMPSLLKTSLLMVILLAIPIVILYFLVKSGKFNL